MFMLNKISESESESESVCIFFFFVSDIFKEHLTS